jgi:hypothetical protein
MDVALHGSRWEMVGQGWNSADMAKKCMWEEKVELWWRMQGHKERKELCKQVSWIKNNPEKAGKMKQCVGKFYQTTWRHILEDHVIHCYSWYILKDAPFFYLWYGI